MFFNCLLCFCSLGALFLCGGVTRLKDYSAITAVRPTKALILSSLGDLQNSEEVFLSLPSNYTVEGSCSELEPGKNLKMPDH